MTDTTGAPEDVKSPPENFLEKAKRLTYNYVQEHLEKTDIHIDFLPDEVYVVWASKTLQNWKALLSTTLPDGMYYELTYNGDVKVTYIDAYKKFENVSVADEAPVHKAGLTAHAWRGYKGK